MRLTPTRTKWNGDPAANRNTCIGGSDIGTVMGINPYKSAYTLWAEKSGLIAPPDLSDKLAVWFGSEEEEIVAKRFTLESGKKVHRSNMSYSLKEYPYFVGHIDRLVEGENAGLECKTTSSWNRTDFESGDVPPAHYAQCQFYMLVTGKPVWYYAVKRDNNGFFWMQVPRNDGFIEQQMIPAAVNFWDHVKSGEAVEPDGSESSEETLSALHRTDAVKAEDRSIILSLSDAEKLEELERVKESIKDLKLAEKEIENQIKEKMGDYQSATAGDYLIKWKAYKTSRIDSKRLKKERKDIYDHYQTESETRRFTYKKIESKEDK